MYKKFVPVIASALIIAVSVLLQYSASFIVYYNSVVYPAYYNFRHSLFSFTNYSIGDVLYFLLGVFLLCSVISLMVYTYNYRILPYVLSSVLKKVFCGIAIIYSFFLWAWAYHYNDNHLYTVWKLNQYDQVYDTSSILKLNKQLVDSLIKYSTASFNIDLVTINAIAKNSYKNTVDMSIAPDDLQIKESRYSYFLERASIEGYLNPFTTEGQINKNVPQFSMPFVVCHEMAHQAGIAYEGDANLLAFVVCATSNHTAFRYAAYFNLWQYANRKLYYIDSVKSKHYEQQLPPIVKHHLKIMEHRAELYDNYYNKANTAFYNEYLRLHQNGEGMKSYASFTRSAWILINNRLLAPSYRWMLH